MPVPSIMPMSMSRTPATPSSSTMQASANAFRATRSPRRGATSAAMRVEPLPGLLAEVAAPHDLAHPPVYVEPRWVVVGGDHVLRNLDRGVEPRHVGEPERA